MHATQVAVIAHHAHRFNAHRFMCVPTEKKKKMSDEKEVRVNFFATRFGQLFFACLLLVASVFVVIAACTALSLAYSLDDQQPTKEDATKGMAWVNLLLGVGGVAGSSAWLYYGSTPRSP